MKWLIYTLLILSLSGCSRTFSDWFDDVYVDSNEIVYQTDDNYLKEYMCIHDVIYTYNKVDVNEYGGYVAYPVLKNKEKIPCDKE